MFESLFKYPGYIDLEEKTLQPLENPFGLHAEPPSATLKAPGETEASAAGAQLAEG